MSQADDATPRLLPVIGGLLILVLSAGLVGVAWAGYTHGAPGVPVTPPEQEGAIVLFAPPGVEFDTLISFTQNGIDAPREDFAADAVLIQIIIRTARPAPFVVVAGFYGDARLTRSRNEQFFEVDEDTYSKYGSKRFVPLGDGNRLFEGPAAPGSKAIQYTYDIAKGGSSVGQTMILGGGAFAHPVFASDNARTVVRTKRLDEVARCPALADSSFAKSFSRDRWLDKGLPTCQSGFSLDEASDELNRNQKTEVSLVPTTRRPRLDFATSPVSGNLTVLGWALTWEFPGNVTARVDASLTDLDEEARGQSYLFASGVAVGLATSFFPGGLKLIVGQLNRRRRWRKALRGQQASQAG